MARAATLIIFAVFFLTQLALGQISPPGLGTANTASWLAFGVRQELDTLKEWQSMSYIGLGQKSNPDNYDPLFKSSILVLNQEFYHQFHKHWQNSFAVSYRRQDQYLDNPPYGHSDPATKQEFRLYSRIAYIIKAPRIKFVPTFRQEFRKFFSPDFRNISENFQFRSRLRLQLTFNIDAEKRHRIIASSEQLFSMSRETSPRLWTNYSYKESRFLLYYSLSPKASRFIFSMGYMNNLVGYKMPYSVHYLAFDIVLENPFKLRQRHKDIINENFE